MEQKVAILVGGINFHVRSYMDKGSMQQIDPLLMATCKAPFLVLPVLDYLRQLSTVYNGVFSAHLRSLFAATWFQPRVHRIQLALLLPGTIHPAVN